MKLQMLDNHILIKLCEGQVYPSVTNENEAVTDPLLIADVLEVGPGRTIYHDDKIITVPVDIAVGDKIITSNWNLHTVPGTENDPMPLYIIGESSVFAKVLAGE